MGRHSAQQISADRMAQAKAFVRWLYPPSGGGGGYVLFFPGSHGFRSQGILAWEPEKQRWLKLQDESKPVDSSSCEKLADPSVAAGVDGMGMMLCPVTGALVPVKRGNRNLFSRRVTEACVRTWAPGLELFEIDEIHAVERVLGPDGPSWLMSVIPLSLRSVVATGGRGAHGLGRSTAWFAKHVHEVKWLLALLGFDPATHIATQITRPPGFRRPSRGTDAWQTLLGLYNCEGPLDPQSPWTDWEAFTVFLTEQCHALNLAGIVVQLEKMVEELHRKLATRPTAEPSPKHRCGKPSGSKNIEAHRELYRLAKQAIEAGRLKRGHAIPGNLIKEFSAQTGIDPGDIVGRFHRCDPFGREPGTLYDLGLVVAPYEYIGGKDRNGHYGIASRTLPLRQDFSSLLAEWGHSISVFALLGFSIDSEVRILHRMVELRDSGASDKDALKSALIEVEYLEHYGLGEWDIERERGAKAYERCLDLIMFHYRNPDVPELADALGQLLDAVKYGLSQTQGDLHGWIDADCPRRRQAFPISPSGLPVLPVVSPSKVRGLLDLLVPGREYTFFEVIELAVINGVVKREGKSRYQFAKVPLALKTSDRAIQAQVRRALEASTRQGLLQRIGNGGRGSFTWKRVASMPASTAPALRPAEIAGTVVGASRQAEGGEESLRTKVAKKEGERTVTIQGDGAQLLLLDAKGTRKEEDPVPLEGGSVRRPFGLLATISEPAAEPGRVDLMVQFGVCRRAARGLVEKKDYCISRPMLERAEFDVVVIKAMESVKPVPERKPDGRYLRNSEGKIVLENAVIGHVIEGLLRVSKEEALLAGVRDFEILGSGWVPVKFFVLAKHGVPTVDGVVNCMLRCSANLSVFDSKKHGRTAVADLTIVASPLKDVEAEKLIDDARCEAAADALRWTNVKTARERREQPC